MYDIDVTRSLEVKVESPEAEGKSGLHKGVVNINLTLAMLIFIFQHMILSPACSSA